MFLRPEPELGWLPTHVQVTILQARGLRAKGKHGTSDAYTLIQVGREKYSTSVVEKTTGSPEWKEECSFELSPGAMERGENCELQLIVMHRALIGMDQFLGKVSLPLQEVYQEGRSQRNQWYKLRSKPGKKEKERGEIQVSIQFTRNNLTASMFDLSIKDKPKTPFGKLKDKLKVKKLSQMESSSAIVPSSIGRLDSDEEDEKKPKSKAAAFFKGRLRKSSLTRSNTSLGSDSTISSTSGTIPTSAGISIVLPDIVKKPASRNGSLSNEPTVKDHEASPRMKHKRAFSDEVSQLKLFPEPKSVQNLKPKGSPISKSSVCINGSHVYAEVPSPKPVHSLEKSSPASMSFQNIAKKAEEVTEVIRGPSHSSEKLEHKPTGPTAEGQNVSSKPLPQPKPTNDPVRVETKPIQITTPMVFSEDVSKNKSQEAKAKEEKPKIGLQPGIGKNDPGNKSLDEPNPYVSTSSEERGKVGSWFGSKDAKETQQKPSFPSGSIATSEAAEWGSSLVEEHSPLTTSCSTEDMNIYSYQGKSDNFEVVVDRPELRLTQSSSSEPPMFTGWEEQFDALASSRLQPSSSSCQQSPEPEDSNITITSASENYPLSSFGKLETMTGMLTPPDGNEWHKLKSNNSNFDTCWPDLLKNDAKKSSELEPSPLLTNFSPTNIPFTRSMGLKEYDNLPTETCKDQNTFNHSCQHVDTPLPASSKNRVASVQPLLQMGQNIVGVEEMARQESPILTKDTVAMALILEVAESGIDVYSTQVSKEAVEQFSTVHNPERIRDEPEVMVTEKVEGIIKEQAISVNVGSVAPSKPPRLMLSSSVEQIETEDYNYQQTSHQDTTGKQMENPEEHMQEQNMGVSKQMVSPVACCPVIEIRSPVLGAFTEDTESTTEGLLTNLREENNDLGALNGEHLLDVNEVTPTEQFRTCPSSVSLGTDLSSVHEGSDKLELINHSSSKPFNLTLGDTKQYDNDFNFQKPMPSSKIQKVYRSELSSLSKKGDQSDFVFWSALEEQIPSRRMKVGTKQNVPTSQGDIALSDGRNVSNMNTGERTEPEQNNNEDVLILMGVESNSPLPIELQDARLEYEAKALRDDSQQSSWSADIIVDFKNEDFWRTNSDQLDQNNVENLPSPGNPFTPVDRTPLSYKNPFTMDERPQSSQSSESSLQEDTSFKDLHAHAALRNFPPAVPPSDMKAPYLHGSPPLAFSTPSLAIAPNPKPSNFPSPIMLLTTSGATTTTNTHTATLSGLLSPVAGGVTTAAPPILPLETQKADNPFMPLKISPHPVKPISATHSESSTAEKKTQRPTITTALSSGLEMLKSVTGGQNATPKKQEQERLKVHTHHIHHIMEDLCLPDQAAKYYHLTHDELIQMLLQRESELSKKDHHVQELEDYIDKLLVRIMDQAPALLQAPLETKK
ncbi:rab11 family-interacting protein 5 isoform X1 [Bufo bufo]|uniref:rab11 family-interacting protein 5 isoform X1 n=1 Tax=Bufo bufo TaxID=8384 RepID=UPI001ABE650E|nr:rab11 family-interacting protein 5 isoform X1 [Bufo bufo]XP_040275276.1 rab11 family-interacting protein 5 isoform X1 [Bufo bufo]